MPGVLKEIVIFQGRVSEHSHKALFSLPDHCYFPAGNDILGAISSAGSQAPGKIHISAGWQGILSVALWKAQPETREILGLLLTSGLAGEEIGSYRECLTDDIFYRLYYARRFDILKRICRKAKAAVEAKIEGGKTPAHCHLVSDATEKIVASSL